MSAKVSLIFVLLIILVIVNLYILKTYFFLLKTNDTHSVVLNPNISQKNNEITWEKKNIQPTFEKILLVVNFNYPYYDVINNFLEMYHKFFPNIVFVGEQPLGERKLPKGVSFLKVSTNHGFFQQNSLFEAMDKFPEYEGYLHSNDDTLLNPWTLSLYDKNSFWIPREYNRLERKPWPYNLIHDYVLDSSVPLATLEPNNWWMQVLNGKTHYSDCQKTWSNESLVSRRYLNALERVYGKGRKVCFQVWCDVFYVPASIRTAFLELARNLTADGHMFEIVFPTVSRMMFEADSVGITFMDVPFLWENQRTIETFNLLVKPNADGAHAIKLSNPNGLILQRIGWKKHKLISEK